MSYFSAMSHARRTSPSPYRPSERSPDNRTPREHWERAAEISSLVGNWYSSYLCNSSATPFNVCSPGLDVHGHQFGEAL